MDSLTVPAPTIYQRLIGYRQPIGYVTKMKLDEEEAVFPNLPPQDKQATDANPKSVSWDLGVDVRGPGPVEAPALPQVRNKVVIVTCKVMADGSVHPVATTEGYYSVALRNLILDGCVTMDPAGDMLKMRRNLTQRAKVNVDVSNTEVVALSWQVAVVTSVHTMLATGRHISPMA